MTSLLRLTELYGDKYERVLPTLHLGEKTITSSDINDAFIRTLPTFATTNKSWILERDGIMDEDFNFIVSGIPMSKTLIQVEFIQVMPIKRVNFFNHNVEKKLVPRMLINVQDHEIIPGTCVFINTGYVIKSASMDQRDFVILPNIVCKDASGKNCKIIPNVHARDEDDCGLFTVSFTLLAGVPAKIQVVFNCFVVAKIADNCIELCNKEPNNEIFKPKDMKDGRAVKNLKIKTHYGSMRRDDDDDSFVEFRTFNHLVSPPVTWPHQTLRVHKYAVITSRRREWSHEDLITLAGTAVDSVNDRLPRIFVRDGTMLNKNTHCITLLESKAVLHSKIGAVNDFRGLSLINGAFSFLDVDFGKIQKRIKIMNDQTDKLYIHKKIVASMCGNVKDSEFGDNVRACNLLRVYDVTQNLSDFDEKIDEINDRILDDAELLRALNVKVTKETKTASSMLQDAMYWLISKFMTGSLSESGIAELRSKLPTIDRPNKRKITTTDDNAVAAAADDDDDASMKKNNCDVKKLKN